MENDQLRQFVKTRDIPFPVALDHEHEAAQKYMVRGTPTSYLIDGERNLAGMAQGPRDWDSEAAKRLIQHYLRQ